MLGHTLEKIKLHDYSAYSGQSQEKVWKVLTVTFFDWSICLGAESFHRTNYEDFVHFVVCFLLIHYPNLLATQDVNVYL